MAERTVDLGMSFRSVPTRLRRPGMKIIYEITKVWFRRSGRVWKQDLPNSAPPNTISVHNSE